MPSKKITYMWKKYSDLEPVRRLRNEGRELIGNLLYLTEKRDGQNISVWLDDNREPQIASHGCEIAESNIISDMKKTPEYSRVVDLLADELKYNHHIIPYGELLMKISPTRIERQKKHLHWVLFDIWDLDEDRFLGYNKVYQHGYHFKIPVVKIVNLVQIESLEHLSTIVQDALMWCKRHRREGVVGKCYQGEQVMFKEKIDLPKRPKLEIKQRTQIDLPPMDEHTALRALQHAYDEVLKTYGENSWSDRAKAMPIVAKHMSIEAREHYFSTPKTMYALYLNTPIEVVRGNNCNDAK